MKIVIYLVIFLGIFLNLITVYPSFAIPPIKKSTVKAQIQEQRGEIIAASFSKPLILPHPGFISTKFSDWHPGIDLASGFGMPIHPIIDGVVEETGRDLFGLGNYVVMAHENNLKSKYAHIGKIYVKAGQTITSENMLGEVGITGRTSGPHTHLEITLNGIFIDPEKLLPEIPTK